MGAENQSVLYLSSLALWDGTVRHEEEESSPSQRPEESEGLQ